MFLFTFESTYFCCCAYDVLHYISCATETRVMAITNIPSGNNGSNNQCGYAVKL